VRAMIKTCVSCGEAFAARNSREVTCSKSCRAAR